MPTSLNVSSSVHTVIVVPCCANPKKKTVLEKISSSFSGAKMEMEKKNKKTTKQMAVIISKASIGTSTKKNGWTCEKGCCVLTYTYSTVHASTAIHAKKKVVASREREREREKTKSTVIASSSTCT